MSILLSTSSGVVLSHQEFIRKVYRNIENDGASCAYEYRPEMFAINTPFKKNLEALKDSNPISKENEGKTRKRKRPCSESSVIAQHVQTQAKAVITAAQQKGIFSYVANNEDICDNNSRARSLSYETYQIDSRAKLPSTYSGANGNARGRLEKFGDQQFLFPNDCRFFCNDVLKMGENLSELGKFDLVIIDPPWWNKYIRRKRARDKVDGYKMLSCEELMKIPVAQLLNPGALLAVWCTNSENHLSDLQSRLMPAWGVQHVSSWCWLKVTNTGEPVCPYAPPPGKQPFEQLLFGKSINAMEKGNELPHPDDGLLLVSVPSAVHSHKPPLIDVLRSFLPPEPKCLEIFARSLLPGCTSWGLEVIKLQHLSLFTKCQT